MKQRNHPASPRWEKPGGSLCPSGNEMTELFGMFAKHWTPGAVKTRLAASIGAAAASELHRQFVLSCARRFRHLGHRRALAYSPADQRPAFKPLAELGWELTPQVEGDLGQRMGAFFQTAFFSGAQRVVLIGSDSPTLPTALIEEAFARLHHAEVVLAPSQDGGYCVVGAANRCPPIFDDMPWSQSSLWEATTERLEQENVTFAQVRQWYDVDELQDLCKLRDQLRRLVELSDDWAPLYQRVLQACPRSP